MCKKLNNRQLPNSISSGSVDKKYTESALMEFQKKRTLNSKICAH